MSPEHGGTMTKTGMSEASSAEESVTQTVACPAVVENALRPSFNLKSYGLSGVWIYPLLLIIFMAVMAYIRIVPSYDSVFTSWGGGYVNVAADDAVYQMRLVHNTLAHFPGRIMFDPFTHFPYGSTVHFGPLFSLLIAGAALVAGLGHPDSLLVDTVGAYMPVLLGVLCALPVYFIGRKLFGRNAGIVAVATLALLPGQFLVRSMLGFTDHHIAEVLFSATTVAFLVYALDSAKKAAPDLAKIAARDSGSWKAMGLATMAGVAFGCYLLVWPGALLVGFMLFVYFVVQSIIDHFRNEPLDYLLIVAAFTFLIPAAMALPYSLQDMTFELMYYSLTQPAFLSLGFAGVAVACLTSKALKQRQAPAWTFPVSLAGIAVAGLVVSYIIMPELFALAMAGFKVFAPGGGMLTVAEARPTIFDRSGAFTWQLLWGYFFWTIPIALVGIVLLAFRALNASRPAELLFLVWSLVMLWATCSQIRFTYYFAVNAALLTGYFAVAMFRAFGSEGLAEGYRTRVKGLKDLATFGSDNAGSIILLATIGLIFLWIIVYPATSLSTGEEGFSFGGYTMGMAGGGSGTNYEWFSTLTWLRDHTPDPQGTTVQPGFDYANGTYAKTFDDDGTYVYPAGAYGVMSWWDYGHIITHIAHRIPNANPFQQGILENDGKDGSCRFFLATDETDGYRNLQDMGSRYVLIDNPMATGKFGAIETWADDTSYWLQLKGFNLSGYTLPLAADSDKFGSSMMSRLYYGDGDNMSHFRLVYQSPGAYYVSTKLGDLAAYATGGQYVPFAQVSFNPSENYSRQNILYQSTVNPSQAPGTPTQFFYDSRPPVKYVKAYEVVKGAAITGHAPAGSRVTAAVNLGIGDRAFTYTRSAIAGEDGLYTLTVPYATDAMKGEGYSSDVTPLSLYVISYGDTTKTVAVPEQAVTGGMTVIAD
jgi:dolichyl-diphosphooligosaccharide--protein glycosyltransferase